MSYELVIPDYKILTFIYRNGSTSETKLYKKFKKLPVDELKYRLQMLTEYKRVHPLMGGLIYRDFDIIEKTNEHGRTYDTYKEKESYAITILGQKMLHDYESNLRASNRQLWKSRALIPIIVSLTTTILLHLLIWWLPLTLQWLSTLLL